MDIKTRVKETEKNAQNPMETFSTHQAIISFLNQSKTGIKCSVDILFCDFPVTVAGKWQWQVERRSSIQAREVDGIWETAEWKNKGFKRGKY